mmetsp:Transcript_6396/g.11731  ORF Transcript_6396/g.11731 Transcript_6396/m.11731 type:complete len:96 (+) Transcript_6396:359-646(+)
MAHHYDTKKPMKLKADVVTRWWSTYDCFDRIVYLEEALKYMMNEGHIENKYHFVSEEFDVLILKQDLQSLPRCILQCRGPPLLFYQKESLALLRD